MNLTENQINEIKSLIKENEAIYEGRQNFQQYCTKKLGININIYDFCNYNDLMSCRQSENDSDIFRKIMENKINFDIYYIGIRLEINNNRKILYMIKEDILNYIKTKFIVSVEQIKKSNFEFLTDFYIKFFLDELHKRDRLEKIEISSLDNKKQIIYKIKQK